MAQRFSSAGSTGEARGRRRRTADRLVASSAAGRAALSTIAAWMPRTLFRQFCTAAAIEVRVYPSWGCRYSSCSSGRSVRWNEPPQHEEVAAAKRAPEGKKQPVESCLQGVPVAYTSEVDRSAMWAPCEQHTLQYLD